MTTDGTELRESEPMPGQPAPETAGNAHPKRRRRLVTAGALLLALVVLAVIAGIARQPSQIEAVAEQCTTILNVGDDGETLTLHTAGKEDVPPIGQLATIEDITCVLDELEVPTYVRTHMSQTRALDGQQTDDFGDFTARWSYHPDSGLALTIRTR